MSVEPVNIFTPGAPKDQRGELKRDQYDIYCPAIGGLEYRMNYLKSSCLIRQANKSCGLKSCAIKNK